MYCICFARVDTIINLIWFHLNYLYYLWHNIWGCVFSSPILFMMIVRTCVFDLTTLIKVEVWIINHCLGLGHETLICTIFIYFYIIMLLFFFKITLIEPHSLPVGARYGAILWILTLTQIAKFMGPTWGPPGSCRPQMDPMLAPWALLSGHLYIASVTAVVYELYVSCFIRLLSNGT